MSRIGKKPVPLPKGVKVKMEDGKLMVTGPGGVCAVEEKKKEDRGQ